MPKMSQEERIILLEELFLNTKNHKLKIKNVKNAYEKKRPLKKELIIFEIIGSFWFIIRYIHYLSVF